MSLFQDRTRRCIFALILGIAYWPAYAEEAEDPNVQRGYYWQGNRLSSQGRLMEPFEGFETETKRAKEGRQADEYLSKVRSEMKVQSAAGDPSKAMVNYNPTTPEQALVISRRPDGGRKLTLYLKALFDENGAAFKNGSLDVLDRVAQTLASERKEAIQLVLVDDLDAVEGAKDVDAERSLQIFSYLSFRASE